MSEAKCGRKDCQNEGTAHPVLLLTFSGYSGPPMEAMLGLLVCDQHQAETSAADLISDEGWAQITEAITAAKKVLPERSLTKLRWEPPTGRLASDFRHIRLGDA